MKHFETELEALKQDFVSMWELVYSQLKSSMQALAVLDKNKAQEVIAAENKVNEFEMKIEKSCEDIIALYNPVANDLRFVLVLIRINTSLEKVGDIANRVSKFIVKFGDSFYQDLIVKTDTLSMFEEACDLLQDTLHAFKNNDSEKARLIFKRDEFINEINKNAFMAIIDSMKEHPDEIEKYMKMLSLIRRIEKAGDICKTIAEEIIFQIEAKVLRHQAQK